MILPKGQTKKKKQTPKLPWGGKVGLAHAPAVNTVTVYTIACTVQLGGPLVQHAVATHGRSVADASIACVLCM